MSNYNSELVQNMQSIYQLITIPDGVMVKSFACHLGDWGSILHQGRSFDISIFNIKVKYSSFESLSIAKIPRLGGSVSVRHTDWPGFNPCQGHFCRPCHLTSNACKVCVLWPHLSDRFASRLVLEHRDCIYRNCESKQTGIFLLCI